MKLLQDFLLPALAAGFASAEQQPTEAYILKQSYAGESSVSSKNGPSTIPSDLALSILLQRLSTPEHPTPLGQLPASISEDDAISFISQFGRSPRPLFDDTDANEPKQLVLAFSGTTPQQYKTLKDSIPDASLSFTSSELSASFLPERQPCEFEQAIDPSASKCWKTNSQYLQYDATKDKKLVDRFTSKVASLKSYAEEGKMETTILFLAPSTGTSNPEELRRRQKESVMTEHSGEVYSPPSSETEEASAKSEMTAYAEPKYPIPVCFESKDECEKGTANCSGRGACGDKWAFAEKNCFVCKCRSTKEKYSNNPKSGDSIFHWGGGACQKIDVSTQFWMFAGVSLVLVSTVAFSISLLFTVGEEKLPGVIGAGVSRSK